MTITDQTINEIIGDMTGTTKVKNHISETKATMGMLGGFVGEMMADMDLTYEERLRFLRKNFGFMFEGITQAEIDAYPWIKDLLELDA